jgi:DNA polymerase-3 subunit beta
MRIEVLQENLKQALSYLQKVIPSKPQMAILSSILLKAEGNKLTLSGTDLYLGIKTEFIVDVQEEGSLVVDGETFKAFINSLKAGKISMELQENSLIVQQGKIKSKFACQDAQEYPQFPEVTGDTFTLSTQDLEIMQSKIMFCASADQTRPVLTSLLMKFSADQLEVVATDGFRLAQIFFKDKNFSLEKELLVPVKAMAELSRIAKQQNAENFSIIVSEELKQLLFQVANVKMYVRLIEGEYPPYNKIIPPDFQIEVNFDTEEFTQELKRAQIFARDASNIVRLEISKDSLLIRSFSASYGEYQGEIPLKNVHENTGKIAFNIHYLLDYLSGVSTESLSFFMNESLKPAEFRESSLSDYLYVVMPFRVND